MSQKYTDDNDGRHIQTIITRVNCLKHGADFGQACWNLPSSRGIMRGICNGRARHAGANGAVTPYIKPPAPTNYKKKEYSR